MLAMDKALTEAWRRYIFDKMLDFCDTEDNPENLAILGGDADEQDPDWFPFDVHLSGAEENWTFSAARLDSRERPIVKGAFLQPWDESILQVVVIEPDELPERYRP
jgi:hypothetical protein